MSEGIFIQTISKDSLKNLVSDSIKKASIEIIKSLNEDKLLIQEEAVAFFKISKPTIINWGEKGIVFPREVGGRVYYLKSDLLKAGKGNK